MLHHIPVELTVYSYIFVIWYRISNNVTFQLWQWRVCEGLFYKEFIPVSLTVYNYLLLLLC